MSTLLSLETTHLLSPAGSAQTHWEGTSSPAPPPRMHAAGPARGSPQSQKVGSPPWGPAPRGNSPLRRPVSISAPTASGALSSPEVPAARTLEPPAGPHLETPRATAASRSPRIPSCGRRRCPRSCRGTRRLRRGSPSAATRETNGSRAPPSPPPRPRCRLRRGGRRGARAGTWLGPTVPKRRSADRGAGASSCLPSPGPGPSRMRRRGAGKSRNLGDKPGIKPRTREDRAGSKGGVGPPCPAPGGSESTSRERSARPRARVPRTCSAGRRDGLGLEGIVGSRGARLVVTVSLLALHQERTRHGGGACFAPHSVGKGPRRLRPRTVTPNSCSAPS